jgi:hypothetical protein
MLNHFLFFLQVQNKPYQPGDKYAFILECGAGANNILPYSILYSKENLRY